MQITTIAKNYVIKDRLITILNKKLAMFERYFDADAVCVVTCSAVHKTEKMEITLTQKGKMFRAESATGNMYSNIDLALAKLEKQIIKNKERLKSVLKKAGVDDKKYAFYVKTPKFTATEVVKNKSFAVEKMSATDAELALDTIGHSFYVYANQTSGKINIMYKRTDGHVGVIEISNSKVV